MRTADDASSHRRTDAFAPVARRPRTTLAMSPDLLDDLFPPVVRARLEEIADLGSGEVLDDFGTARAAAVLADTEVLLTCWGCPAVDAAVLDRAPRLRAIVHAAGTVKPFLAPEAFARGVAVSTAAAANALPVAEFTLAAIIMGAKRVFPLSRSCTRRRAGRTARDLAGQAWLGTAGLTIGVVGASRTGRRVIQLLHQVLEAEVLLYDPYVSAAEAAALGAVAVDMDTLVATSDVITVHAPDTAETRHLLDARRIALMRRGTLLVNTARGRLVDTEALTEHLTTGRLDAVLDVSDPEPLPADHPLWELENVLLTPHLAGAQGNEVARLGAAAVDEVARFAAGLPLRHAVLADDLGRIA